MLLSCRLFKENSETKAYKAPDSNEEKSASADPSIGEDEEMMLEFVPSQSDLDFALDLLQPLFLEPLRPVNPKAQAAVPIPEGLDLDVWISHEEEKVGVIVEEESPQKAEPVEVASPAPPLNNSTKEKSPEPSPAKRGQSVVKKTVAKQVLDYTCKLQSEWNNQFKARVEELIDDHPQFAEYQEERRRTTLRVKKDKLVVENSWKKLPKRPKKKQQ